MKNRMIRVVATALSVLAVAVVTTASWMYFHQDETPQELLR